MNKHLHRLVFDRRRGMRVATAETARSASKAAGGGSRACGGASSGQARAISAVLSMSVAVGQVMAAPAIPRVSAIMATRNVPNLPEPMSSSHPNAGRAPVDSQRFVQSGSVKYVLVRPDGKPTELSGDARQMVIDQSTSKAILNWGSFNIGKGNTVEFRQPTGGSTLNYIWDANPSVINGALKANGEVILQNTNGVIFGPNATVDTGKLVATALQLDKALYEKGFRGNVAGEKAFGGEDASPDGFVSIERGAEIRTAAGGEVLIMAPRVVNEGRIETPGGQTVMAAGQTVYLANSLDKNQRGLLVAVDSFKLDDLDLNTVEQAAAKSYQTTDSQGQSVTRTNEVVAERGSINLVAKVIRQNGHLKATTAVKGENGAIYLQAQDQSSDKPIKIPGANGASETYRGAATGGTVILGQGSVTEVLPDTGDATQLDAEAFSRSKIQIEGQAIVAKAQSVVRANSGDIRMIATAAPNTSGLGHGVEGERLSDESRVVIERGAVIDASGLKDVQLKMSTNLLDARLFQAELTDSPVQRNTPVYRASVVFDARLPRRLANLDGYVSQVQRSAQEKSITGGTITMLSDGAVVLDQGATLDISGGNVFYESGQVRLTSLLRVGDHYVDIANADPKVRYDEVINSPGTRLELAYRQGADAGTATLAAPRMWVRGKLAGGVVAGPRQRGGDSTAVAPVAGAYLLGQTYYGESHATSKDARQVLKELVVSRDAPEPLADGFWSDPAGASISAVPETLHVSVGDLLGGGASRLSLSAEHVVQERDAALNLGSRGLLAIDASRVELNAAVRSAGGKVDVLARSGDIVLGDEAKLSVAGNWTNDRRAPPGDSPLIAMDGGSIEMLAFGDIDVAAGALLDVSAGAWSPSSGGAKTGEAGRVSLSAGSYLDLNSGSKLRADQLKRVANNTDPILRGGKAVDELGQVRLDGALRGFGFAGGGTLVLKTGAITLAEEPDVGQGLTLTPGFFSDNGFSAFDLSAAGAVTVLSGTQVDARLKNALLSTSAQNVASSDVLPEDLLQHQSLTQDVRQAVKLNLGSVFADGNTKNFDLHVQQGARLSTDAGGTIGLAATGSVVVEGELIAPGGAINLTINGQRGSLGVDTGSSDPVLFPQGSFDAAQSIWLGSHAYLSVAGSERTSLDVLGRPRGEVLAGGQISLKANKGYVVAQAGSVMDLSGIQAPLYFIGLPDVQQVSRAAGTLTVSTPEGFALDGRILAGSPGGPTMGGTVSLGMTLNGRNPKGNESIGYDAQDRRIELSNDRLPGVDASAEVPQWGQDLTSSLGRGLGRISAQALEEAGFAEVKLTADNRISLTDNVNLDLSSGRSLTLNTRIIEGLNGSHSELSAPYVSLGDRDLAYQAVNAFKPDTSATKGQADLTVRAGLIESVGAWGAQGFDRLTLDAHAGVRTDGEVRFVGRTYNPVTVKSDGALKAGLNFAGVLELRAGLIDASSTSAVTVKGLAGSNSTILTSAPGGSSAATPLTALASMVLSADKINHEGVIKLPFGHLTLDTADLTLAEGSLLSTSGAGITVPLGTTINGTQWLFSPLLGGSLTDQSGKIDLTAALAQGPSIVLDADSLHMSPKAVLDMSGGGDIQASEFVKGVGGSTDYLARNDVFAVIQGWRSDFSATDAELSAGSTLKPGAQIEITMAGSGLAPGRYTLLPAKYALLEGAFVVSKAKDQGSSVLQRAVHSDDGSATVTGYFTAAGATVAGDPGQRFVVEPSSTYRAKSKYVLTSANAMRDAQAAREGMPLHKPSDAGALTVVSTNPFDFQAQLNFAAPAGSASGALDVVTKDGRIVVVDDWADAGADSTRVAASVLDGIGNPSVLLGGTRTVKGADLDVKVSGQSVSVLADAETLRAGEWLLVGKEGVTLADGVKLQAEAKVGATPATLSFDGDKPSDGALLMLSGRTGLAVKRLAVNHETAASPLTGDLSMPSNVLLAGAALQLDASRTLVLPDGPGVSLEGVKSLGLSGPRLALGGISNDVHAVNVQGPWLTALVNAEALQLHALTSIDFIGSTSIGESAKIKQVVLDAPLLRGLNDGDAQAVLRAEQITVRNSSGAAANPQELAEGHGQLRLEALPRLVAGVVGGLLVGPGAVTLGFDQAVLSSRGDLLFSGQSSLTAKGDLSLEASRVSALSAAQSTVVVGGLLTIDRPDASKRLPILAHVGQGAALSFEADQIRQNGVIDLAAGSLDLLAHGRIDQDDSVSFGSGSVTSVAGFTLDTGDGWSAQGSAGSIRVTAQNGNVLLDGTVDVSAGAGLAGGARAGALSIAAQGRDGRPADLLVADASTLRLKAEAKEAALSGSFQLDGASVRDKDSSTSSASLDRLANALLLSGAQREIAMRVRRGDVELGAGATLKAQRVMLSADQGAMTINGTVDATAPQGGMVQLAAQNDFTLGDQAKVLAASTRAGANGGDVLLATAQGVMRLAATAKVDASGDGVDDGRIVLRMPLSLGETTLNGVPDGEAVHVASVGAVLKAAKVDVEATTRYEAVDALVNFSGDGSQATLGLDQLSGDWLFSDPDAAHALLATLGLGSLPQARLAQGVEIISRGDLSLDEALNLNAMFGGRPGYLTIRSVGDLSINASISDGFDSTERLGAVNVDTAGSAWSYRLVAGADVAAASPLQLSTSPDAHGTLTVAGDTIVRTTSGSIELAAAGDVRLETGDQSSGTVYVAGAKVEAQMGDLFYKFKPVGLLKPLLPLKPLNSLKDITPEMDEAQVKAITVENEAMAKENELIEAENAPFKAANAVITLENAPILAAMAYNDIRAADLDLAAAFTRSGGRLEVHAGQDVLSDAPRQTFAPWSASAGLAGFDESSVNNLDVSLAWWANPDAFRQGLGSFGGGNAWVTAGRDVRNLTVVSPTSGRVGRGDWIDTSPVIDNGGDVTVHAGRDILGGTYLLGRGQGLLQAGRAVTKGDAIFTRGNASQAPSSAILGLADGNWSMVARGDLSVAAVLNPSAMWSTQEVGLNFGQMFFTYAPGSSVSLESSAGSIDWITPSDKQWDLLANHAPSLSPMEALGENLSPVVYNVAPPVVIVKALTGSVTLGGPEDMLLHPSAQGQLSVFAGGDLNLQRAVAMLDINPAAWLDVRHPLSLTAIRDIYAISGGVFEQLADPDKAVSGTIAINSSDFGLNEVIPVFTSLHADDAAPARLHSDGSVLSTARLVLPKAATISAGLDIKGLSLRGQNLHESDVTSVKAGRDLSMVGSEFIALTGPGLLDVQAGRFLDLGASFGIETRGNVDNPSLPEQGASVRVGGGLSGTLNVNTFLSRYVGDAAAQADNRDSLIAFIRALGLPAGTIEQARSQFAELPDVQQLTFARQVMAQQFLATYVGQPAPLTPDVLDAIKLDMVRHVRAVQGLKAYDEAIKGDTEAEKAESLQARDETRALMRTQYEASLAVFKGLSFDQQFALTQVIDAEANATAATTSYAAQNKPYALIWQTLAQANGWSGSLADSPLAERFNSAAMFAEVQTWGSKGAVIANAAERDAAYARAFQAIDLRGLGDSFRFNGSVDLVNSKVHTKQGGLIELLAPGGNINVGASNDVLVASDASKESGVVTYGNGGIHAMSLGDFQVNTKKAFVVGAGDILAWSSKGSVNSGVGANTTITIARSKARRRADGNVEFLPPPVTSGSGIGILGTSGNVYLFAPNGEVLALDALIRSPGKVVLGAPVIKGGDNIVGGSVVGAAVAVPAVSLALNNASTNQPPTAAGPASLSDASASQKERNALLTVDLLGLGEPGAGVDPTQETDDKPCLPGDKRPKCSPHEKAK